MSKKNNKEISKQEISKVRRLAIRNKPNVMRKNIRIKIDDVDYSFIIKGIGRKSVKLELYIDYETLLKNKDDGIVEKKLYGVLNTIYEGGRAISSSEVSE